MSTPDTRPAEASDSLEDHRLLHRRMGAALLQGDAESGPSAMSRLGSGALAGVFVTIAVVALVGIIAILRPGGATAWQQPGAFIVAEETGTRYLYRDGLLSPVANYASAKLLLGNDLHVVSVSTRSLASALPGPSIGIAMAPDSLPGADGMVGTDWSVCAAGNPADGAGTELQVSVLPGQSADGEPLGQDDSFLLRAEDGRSYLIWAARAYEIGDRWLPALGFQPDEAVAVEDDFIAALPAGPPIAPPVIEGVGQPGRALAGETEVRAVGTIFGDLNNAFYVMTGDGLAGLTQLQAALLLADPQLAPAYSGGSPSALPITAAQVTAAMVRPLPVTGGDPEPPTAALTLSAWPAGEQQLCLRWADQQAPDMVIGPVSTANPATADGDLVRLPAGGGALAATLGGPGVDMTVYLITDSGVRYPIAGQQALDQLGLTGVSVARVPAAVLDLLRVGPTLDVEAAGQPLAE